MKLLSLCLLSAGLALALCGKLVGTVFVLAAAGEREEALRRMQPGYK